MSPERNVTYVSGMDSESTGADDGIRTCDLLFTKQLLYP